MERAPQCGALFQSRGLHHQAVSPVLALSLGLALRARGLASRARRWARSLSVRSSVSFCCRWYSAMASTPSSACLALRAASSSLLGGGFGLVGSERGGPFG